MSRIGVAALAVMVSLACTTGANAAPAKRAIEKAIEDMNANKPNKACAPAGAIIDEFAPFSWDSFASWSDALGKYNAQNAITDSKTSHVKFRHINVEGDRAYAVLSVLFTYKQAGHARSEQATEALALEKGASGWCPESFAWFDK